MTEPFWPPPLASRAIRRHCQHQAKGGYCVHCGTQIAPAEANAG